MGDEAKEFHPQGWWSSTHKHWKGILGSERRMDKDAELRKAYVVSLRIAVVTLANCLPVPNKVK